MVKIYFQSLDTRSHTMCHTVEHKDVERIIQRYTTGIYYGIWELLEIVDLD